MSPPQDARAARRALAEPASGGGVESSGLASDDVRRTTALLERVVGGDRSAQAELYAAVSAELRQVAGHLMRAGAAGHTLQPTALVNEAWIRLIGGAEKSWGSKSHFLCVAAKAMRSILVDHVRAKRSRKRGGDLVACGLDEAVASLEAGDTDLLDLEQALRELEEDDAELARVVELRFFGGLSQPEVATALGVSLSTVERAWRVARARLHRRLGRTEEGRDALE